MADEFQVASLDGLDRSQQDYPTKLEHGLIGIEESLGVQFGRRNDLINGSEDNLMRRLCEIEGVTVTPMPEASIDLDLGCGHMVSARAYAVNAESLARQRYVEDVEIGYKRELRAGVEAIDDRIRALQRADIDFKNAAIDLTEVTPLNRIDGVPSSLHFYVLRDGKVYEGHVDIDSGEVTNPAENTRLKPEYFEERETKSGFGTEASRLRAEAYLVRNPVSLVPPLVVFAKAAQGTIGEIRERNAAADERRSGYERLVSSLKDAINYFRRGSR